MGQLLHFPRPAGIVDVRPVQPEVVATLLLALEDAPLYRPTAYGAVDISGLGFVAVRLDGLTLRLNPADARLAAAALEAEQAFVGCMEDARALRDAAAEADLMVRRRQTGRVA